MPRKQKFKPEISRVKLNPEQAVLTCGCFTGLRPAGGVHDNGGFGIIMYCAGDKSEHLARSCAFPGAANSNRFSAEIGSS